MADETLRLPSTTFQAVFNLGPKRAADIALPLALSQPELYAEWHESEQATSLYVEFEDGELHLDCSEAGIDHHFHGPDADDGENSPWPAADTATLLEWASVLVTEFLQLMPDLMEDIHEAASWHDAGYPLYVCVTDPAPLDLIEVEIEGEILTLPWLGSGYVSHEHLDGDNHPIALLWNPDHDDPDRGIARAWLDPATGEPGTAVEPGIDWLAVGLSESEVLGWLEGTYLNHHIIPDAESALMHAVLERLGGID